MKQKTLNKIRKIAEIKLRKSKAPKCIIKYRCDFIAWEVLQKLKSLVINFTRLFYHQMLNH
jgi:hypothetical protein